MARSRHFWYQAQAELRCSERRLLADASTSLDTIRRAFRHAIKRLELTIAVQEHRVKRLKHHPVGTPAQTLQLRTSAKDLLQICRLTVQLLRQSAETLEISWAMLE